MNRNAFLKLLTKHLYPVLRAEGFVGLGQTLRRIQSPVIHVFNVQGSASGGQCYLNLGAHLEFLPTEGGIDVAPEVIEEAHCVFRDRMEPPPGEAFGWAYCTSMEEAEENVEFIVSEWHGPGRAFFERYGDYPRSFEQLLAQSDPQSISSRAALHFARIAAHLGDGGRAQIFIAAGLAKASDRATALKADFAKLERSIAAI